jgi:hypothetical protein
MEAFSIGILDHASSLLSNKEVKAPREMTASLGEKI